MHFYSSVGQAKIISLESSRPRGRISNIPPWLKLEMQGNLVPNHCITQTMLHDGADSYHPISLTSCVKKLMEHLINTRLMWHLGGKQHISPEQAAIRQDQSTEDQIMYIAQVTEDTFQAQKCTLVIWIDLEKALDKVWREGLNLKMQQCKLQGGCSNGSASTYTNKKPELGSNITKSRNQALKQGVPQGGMLSPSLFLIFIKDITEKLPKNVQGSV